MLLTKEQREVFIQWLQQDSMSNELIADQMKDIPHLAPLYRMKKAIALAEQVVLKELTNCEEQIISGKDLANG